MHLEPAVPSRRSGWSEGQGAPAAARPSPWSAPGKYPDASRLFGSRGHPMSALSDRSVRPSRRRARRLRPAHEALEVRSVPTGVTASFAVTQDWGTGFQAAITLASSQPTAVTNWSLAFDDSASITSIWNAQIASHVGTHYVVVGDAWDGASRPAVRSRSASTPAPATRPPARRTNPSTASPSRAGASPARRRSRSPARPSPSLRAGRHRPPSPSPFRPRRPRPSRSSTRPPTARRRPESTTPRRAAR